MLLLLLALAVLCALGAGLLGNWRAGLVAGFFAWAALALGMAEGLGVLHQLRAPACFILWVLPLLAAVVMRIRILAWLRLPRPQRPRGVMAWVSLSLTTLLFVSVLLRALGSAPNAPDVLNYHLPRQLLWMQQGSLDHFLTPNDRMLMMMPLGEVLQLQFMLLSGGVDTYAALPQVIAFVVGAVLASLLVRELGGRAPAQWLGALLFATLPMAYHQASSSKNDLLMAVFVMGTLYFALRLFHHRRRGFEWVALGLGAGLALATKSSALLFLAPIAVLLFGACWWQRRHALLALLFAVALPLPHTARNLATYGHPLGNLSNEDGAAQVADPSHLNHLLSNGVRQLTLHTASPWPSFNAQLEQLIRLSFTRLGLDADDPGSTLLGTSYGIVWGPDVESVAGAPFMLLAAAIALCACWLRGGHHTGEKRLAWLILLLGCLLVCVFLRWQPWGARLHLPLFGLACALVASTTARLLPWASLPVGLLSLLCWLPGADTSSRPLWHHPTIWETTRWEDWFRGAPQEAWVAENNLEIIRRSGARSLYVDNIHNAPYPVMRRLLDDSKTRYRFWGDKATRRAGPPEAIWAYSSAQPLPLERGIQGFDTHYIAYGRTDPWVFYLPEAKAIPLAHAERPNFVGFCLTQGLGAWEVFNTPAGPLYLRRITRAGASLGFSEAGLRPTLDFSLYNRSTPCRLELRVDGRIVCMLAIGAGAQWQSATLPLQLERGSGTLSLQILPEKSGGPVPESLTFLRLRLEAQAAKGN
jgi:hypothetical protein